MSEQFQIKLDIEKLEHDLIIAEENGYHQLVIDIQKELHELKKREAA